MAPSNEQPAMQPPHFSLEDAIRSVILQLPAYKTSTSDESQPRADILLDANENSLGSCLAPRSSLKLATNGHTSPNKHLAYAFFETAALHRYPSCSQWRLKRLIAECKGLPGNDETENHTLCGLISSLRPQACWSRRWCSRYR